LSRATQPYAPLVLMRLRCSVHMQRDMKSIS